MCRVLDRHLAMLECSWPSICARSKPPAQPNSEQLIKGSHILLLDFAGTQNQIGRVVLLPRSNASTCHARCHSRPVRYTNVHTGSVSMATRTTTDAHPRENCIAADTACIVWTTNSKSARARVEVAADSPSSRTRFPFPPPSPPHPQPPSPPSAWHCIRREVRRPVWRDVDDSIAPSQAGQALRSLRRVGALVHVVAGVRSDVAELAGPSPRPRAAARGPLLRTRALLACPVVVIFITLSALLQHAFACCMRPGVTQRFLR